jgi:hypothetical protein
MDAGDEWQAYLADKTGQRTVPMIFIHEKFIGGTSFLHLASSGSEARERRIRSDAEGEGTMEVHDSLNRSETMMDDDTDFVRMTMTI